MNKFCPFLNDKETLFTENQINCNKNCALYVKGFCSFSVLAQKAINDYEQEKKSSE